MNQRLQLTVDKRPIMEYTQNWDACNLATHATNLHIQVAKGVAPQMLKKRPAHNVHQLIKSKLQTANKSVNVQTAFSPTSGKSETDH